MNKNTLATRKWANKHKHPCLDCGIAVHRRSQRCKSCACTLKNKERIRIVKLPPKTYLCPDCGNPFKGCGKRCLSCARKHIPIGKVKTSHGYIIVYLPHHPRANTQGYVYEHILVWEQAHGKPVPTGWKIHHFNGIRSDNRPRNLVAMPSMKHRYLIEVMARRIQELEALLNNQGQLL